MGGRPLAWLVRAWVVGLVLPLGADSPLPHSLRVAAVGARDADGMLVGIAPGALGTASVVHATLPRARARSATVSAAPLASRAQSDLREGSPQPVRAQAMAAQPGRLVPAPRCQAALWLAGSVVNDVRPRLSLAMVRRAAGTAVVSLGGRVDDFTVLSIEPTRARLRASDGSECTLSEAPPGPMPVLAGPLPPTTVAPEPGDKPPPGKAMFASGELTRGVRVLGSGSYTIARSLVLKALANPGGAAGGAWFRLFERDGQRVGMEVKAVREGTPLAAMGLRTGDVARSVNGIALDTPAGLIEALRAAREADTITLSIQRDGQASDMRYTIE